MLPIIEEKHSQMQGIECEQGRVRCSMCHGTAHTSTELHAIQKVPNAFGCQRIQSLEVPPPPLQSPSSYGGGRSLRQKSMENTRRRRKFFFRSYWNCCSFSATIVWCNAPTRLGDPSTAGVAAISVVPAPVAPTQQGSRVHCPHFPSFMPHFPDPMPINSIGRGTGCWALEPQICGTCFQGCKGWNTCRERSARLCTALYRENGG